MAIQMAGWTICSPGELIARQYDNLRRIEVTGDIPDGYSWDLLLCCGNLYDAIPLQAASGGLSATLTAAQCSEFGPYYIQLRGTEPGGAVRHTNVVPTIVPRSVSGTASWPTIPSEFEALEARMRDIASHPPIPGEDGKWQIWDPDAGKYVPSDFPLPGGGSGSGESYVVNVWAYGITSDDTETSFSGSATYDTPREQFYQGVKDAIASGSPVYANVIITDATSADEAIKVSPDRGQKIALTTAYDAAGVIGYYFAGNSGGSNDLGTDLRLLIGEDRNGRTVDMLAGGAHLTPADVYELLADFAGQVMSLPINSITGATVGQILKVTEVDADGKPTAYAPVDMPSGGGGGEVWEQIKTIELTEDVRSIVIDIDDNRGAFALQKVRILMEGLAEKNSVGCDIFFSNVRYFRGVFLNPTQTVACLEAVPFCGKMRCTQVGRIGTNYAASQMFGAIYSPAISVTKVQITEHNDTRILAGTKITLQGVRA